MVLIDDCMVPLTIPFLYFASKLCQALLTFLAFEADKFVEEKELFVSNGLFRGINH